MNIIISNAVNIPIYEQLYNQIRSMIISGELKEKESLPSIRNLAKDLRISVVTTKKAYDQLEHDGYINTVHGKGSYVAEKNITLLQEIQLKEIEEHMKKIIDMAPSCNLDEKDLIAMFKLLMEE